MLRFGQYGRFLIGFSGLILASCKEEPIAPGGGGSPWLTRYPVDIGRQWNYSRTLTVNNIRILDSTYVPPDTSVSYSVTVRATRILKLPVLPTGSSDSISVTEFSTVTDEPMIPESFDYYEQTPEELLVHGYIGGSNTTPKQAAGGFGLSVNGFHFLSVHDLTGALYGRRTLGDEIVREYPPLTALTYPLTPDSSWTYRPDQGPFRIDKVVLSVKDSLFGFVIRRVTILQWLYDFDQNGTWDDNVSVKDYFSTEGLLRRVVDLKDVHVTSSSGPDPIAIVDFKEDLVLGGQ